MDGFTTEYQLPDDLAEVVETIAVAICDDGLWDVQLSGIDVTLIARDEDKLHKGSAALPTPDTALTVAALLLRRLVHHHVSRSNGAQVA